MASNFLDYLFWFPVVWNNLQRWHNYILVFDGCCRRDFEDLGAVMGEQTLAFDCVLWMAHNQLTISGLSWNTVDITPRVPMTYDCTTGDIFLNEWGACETSINISLLITDATIIANITDPTNRDITWYTGPLTGDECIWGFYRDPATGTWYQFDGTTFYRFDTLPLDLQVDVVYGWVFSDPLSLLPRLTDLIIANSLVPGTKYRITDYQTIHCIPHTTELNINSATYTWTTEPLIVTAITGNTISNLAKSELFPEDEIRYNIDDNIAFSDRMRWYAYVSSSSPTFTGPVLVSNITGTTFDIDFDPEVGWFKLSVNDHIGGRYSTEDWTLTPTDYTIVETVPGTTWTVTILLAIDLTQMWAEISIERGVYLAARPGWIYHRKDTIQNIEFQEDFRNTIYRRRAFDFTWSVDGRPVTWDITTQYFLRNCVYHNGNLYIGRRNGLWFEPGAVWSEEYRAHAMYLVDNMFVCTDTEALDPVQHTWGFQMLDWAHQNATTYYWNPIPIDATRFIDFYIFSLQETEIDTPIYNDDWFKWINIWISSENYLWLCNTIFTQTFNEKVVTNVNIKDALENTFYWVTAGVHDISIGRMTKSTIRNIMYNCSWDYMNNFKCNQTYNCRFGLLRYFIPNSALVNADLSWDHYSSFLSEWIFDSNIMWASYNNVCRSIYNCSIATWFNNNVVWAISNSSIWPNNHTNLAGHNDVLWQFVTWALCNSNIYQWLWMSMCVTMWSKVEAYDFTGNTTFATQYQKQVFRRSDLSVRVSYVDASDNIVIVPANT